MSISPNNPSKSKKIMHRNEVYLKNSRQRIFEIISTRKFWKLEAQEKTGYPDHYYDDDISQTLAEEFLDRFSVLFFFGDIARALGGIIRKRPILDCDMLYKNTLSKIINDEKISRHDIACFTDVHFVTKNSFKAFMNGGPEGEVWNTAEDGFYESIKNARHSIIGIELGFKADEYGKKVADLLIQKKNNNPDAHIALLIDGFVSIIMSDTNPFDEFHVNTKKLIEKMRAANIDVITNDSWNPASLDFLAANHIKTWIFDGNKAFVGGIGIESQFVKTLYDQMDLIEGPFVRVLVMMAFLLFTNQKRISDADDNMMQMHEMIRNDQDRLKEKFLPEIKESGEITMELSMNVPGYIQDAQKDYYKLLLLEDVDEIFIMAPYFSDDKVARALVKTAKRIETKYKTKYEKQILQENPSPSKKELQEKVIKMLESNKKVHVIFPKKQENVIIAEVSKYYAYAMRKNKIVETKQFVAKKGKIEHEMLHAKQMVIVRRSKNYTKYVKFGGSYNPAGRAHNMWELNTISYLGDMNQDDSDKKDNPVKSYLDDVFGKVLKDYSEPFRWGNYNVKLKPHELFVMWFSMALFV